MADESLRNRPHIYLRDHGKIEGYTAHRGQRSGDGLPVRDRQAHADQLTQALTNAVKAGEALLAQRDSAIAGGTPGFYLEFELPVAQAEIIDKLEKRGKTFPIELASVRPLPGDKVAATVFVPEKQRDYYLKKVEAYRSEDRRPNQKGETGPKNETLIASIETVRVAVARSLYTDKPDLFPDPGVVTWWEVWLRIGTRTAFDAAARRLDLMVREHVITFPDREVVLVCATAEVLGHIVANTDAITELRLARDTPGLFMVMDGAEQRRWSEDLARRITPPPADAPAVCLLDSGTTYRHPLIQCGLDPADQQAYDRSWPVEDTGPPGHGGHGTQMSGLALHGDLVDVLATNGPVLLRHRLESVKILPDRGANDPDLYGAITAQAVYAAEIVAPHRPRAVCLAVTSPGDHWRGKPSSWSAALDKLAFGEPDIRRLIAVSAGNIGQTLKPEDYPARNDTTPIESPAQAWNVLTIGAYTEKITLADKTYAGWSAFAPAGDLMPTSRTSVSWNWDWPLKPDIVLEGGNLGIDPATGAGDNVDDLALLTTFRVPEDQPFTTTGETSGATALAARMAAQILAERPQLWPETVRALIVHSAEWTPAMKAHLVEFDKHILLRRVGFGVPSLNRALRSLDNDVTLVIERAMQPFQIKGSKIKTKDLVLHQLPWPKGVLETLGAADVELHVTLSYFIEPNPGERGYTRRHGYASHGLRFEVKRSKETDDAFMRRINAQAGDRPNYSPNDPGWVVGPRLRNRGSLHSDTWKGSAADLAARGAIAVYPTGGWWRENPSHQRGNSKIRYSLIVSLRTAESVNLYNAIQTQIAPEIGIET
nr:S8 family peptidase [uncultured Rhodopila sp.]